MSRFYALTGTSISAFSRDASTGALTFMGALAATRPVRVAALAVLPVRRAHHFPVAVATGRPAVMR